MHWLCLRQHILSHTDYQDEVTPSTSLQLGEMKQGGVFAVLLAYLLPTVMAFFCLRDKKMSSQADALGDSWQ